MSDPANPLLSCENCGVQFEPAPDEIVSSRVLCPKCAAERRAKLRAAKAAATAGPAAPAPAAPAPAAARPAQKAPQPAAAPAATATRSAPAAKETPARAREGTKRGDAKAPSKSERHPHHDPDYNPRQHREDDRKKLMKLAWMVTGGLSLIVGVVLLVVFNKQETRANEIQAAEKKLDDFLDYVKKVDLTKEEELKQAKERINAERSTWRGKRIEGEVSAQKTKIDSALARLIQTRGVTEKLNVIETQVGGSPTQEILGKLYASVREVELITQATDFGGEYKARHDRLMKQIYRAYIDSLRTSATAAASATTGEALAPFGTLEDVLHTVRNDAIIANDLETQGLYAPMWKQVYGEINGIVSRMFDEAYRNKIPWQDLLADPTGWSPVASSSFTYKFGAVLTLTNEAEGSTGGLAYFPKADNWRDYVIDLEFKCDSGSFAFYTRIGDKMDSKECPAFTAGTQKNPNVTIEYGKTYQALVSTIGDQLVVVLDGTVVHSDGIMTSKSRKGEPGIAVQTGSSMTISRLKVRHLR